MSTPVTPSVPSQGGLGALLDKLNIALGGTTDDPSHAALMGFAMGLGKAGAPHMLTPVPFGTALSIGEQGAQQYQAGRLSNLMQQAVLPATQAKTQAIVGALNTPNSYPASAFIDNILGGQAGVSNDPNIAGPATLAKTLNSFQKLPANQRAYIFSLLKKFMPQGSMPEGTTQNPDGSISTMSGAPTAIAANAFNKSGGAAAGSYPVSAALSYHTRAPGAAGGTLGPRPAPFVPMVGAPPSAAPGVPAPSPAALAAAQAAARQRQIGTMQGVSQAAQTAGAPAPLPPPPSRGSGTNPGAFNMPQSPVFNPGLPSTYRPAPSPAVIQAAQAQARQRALAIQQAVRQRAMGGVQGAPGAPMGAPAPAGGGLVSQGMTPAQVAMSTGQGKQAVEMNAGYQKQAEDAKETLAQVAELRMAANDFTPGQFAESRIKGLQWMQSLGLITPKEMQQLGSAQEGTKMSIQLQSTLTRSLGNREAAQVFATLGKGVPNLALSPDGFNKMTAYMSGMARYNQARAGRSQQAFNAGDIAGVNNVRNQYIANSNPAYFIISSASPQIQREMIGQMGGKARPFLQRWQAATQAGWAPSPTAFASQP